MEEPVGLFLLKLARNQPSYTLENRINLALSHYSSRGSIKYLIRTTSCNLITAQ